VDAGETPEDALKRELFEELGIETETGAFLCRSCYDYSHLSVELLAYRVSHVSGEMIPHVHDEIRWVKPEDLSGYDFPGANLPVINAVMDRDKKDKTDR
jgi:mutator protein MutT